jgi:hypothetical protein
MIATFLITFLFKDRQITQVTPTLKRYTGITSETSVSTYKPKGLQNPVEKIRHGRMETYRENVLGSILGLSQLQ